MDNATHILYRRCTECPEARRKLQRMASVADRVAFVREHYHTLYDEEVVRAQRPFAYRVGQWYTKRLRYSSKWASEVICAWTHPRTKQWQI